jgi:hypothetical protein
VHRDEPDAGPWLGRQSSPIVLDHDREVVAPARRNEHVAAPAWRTAFVIASVPIR